MSNEIFFDGVQYASASFAARAVGRTRDYIARLCKEDKVPGKRVGKNWYVDLTKLKAYLVAQETLALLRREDLRRERAKEYQTHAVAEHSEPRCIDGVKYVAAADAARESGLTRDYIARLCREKKITGVLAGSIWYVDAKSLQTFLVTQEYEKEKRREHLTRKRSQEYRRVAAQKNLAALEHALAESGRGGATAHRSIIDMLEIPGVSNDSLPTYAAAALAPMIKRAITITLIVTLIGGTYALIDPAGIAETVSYALHPSEYSKAPTTLVSDMVATQKAQLARASAISETPVGFFARVTSHVRGFLASLISPFLAGRESDPGSVAVSLTPYPSERTVVTNNTTNTYNNTYNTYNTTNNKSGDSYYVENSEGKTTPFASGLDSSGQAGMTEAELDSKLKTFADALRFQTVPSGPPASGGLANSIAITQRIDNLNGTRLSNITVSGVSGLSDADIPDGITASNYLALSGGTLAGILSNTNTGTSTFSGGLSVGTLNVSSTTTVSTFGNGINLANGCFAVNGNCVASGSGVSAGGSDSQVQFNNGGTLSGISGFTYASTTGYLGVGTTTPQGKFSIAAASGDSLLFQIATSSTTLFSVNSDGTMIFTNASGTAATTTSFFSTTSSSTQTFSTSATFGTAAIGSLSLGTALATTSGGLGTSTWQTGSVPYFNGSYFTENNARFNFDGTKLTATYASSTALSVSGIGYFGTATSTTLNANTANIGTLNGGNGLFVGTLGVTGASTLTGLTTFTNGYVSQASSTVVGAFTTTGNAILGGTLTVNGLCVSADTRLRRRRKNAKGEYEYDEPEIIDIEEGDEIQSLDEKTGRLVWSRVKKLAFMGVKQTYRLTTISGRSIRTTANHPYLVRRGRGDTMEVPGGEGNLGSAHSGTPGAGGQYEKVDAHRFNRLVATGSTSYPAHGKATGYARGLSRTIAFIDYANVKAWARRRGTAVDLEGLKIVLALCGISRVSIYYGVDTENEGITTFMRKLRSFGYEIVSKPIQYFKVTLTELLEQYVNARWINALRPEARYALVAEAKRLDAERHSFLVPKANFDVEITLDVMRAIDKFDHLVLFSGDGDFAPLVSHLKISGKRTTVVSGREFLAGSLRAAAHTAAKLEDIVKLAPGLIYALGADGSYKKPTPAHEERAWENCASSIVALLGLSTTANTAVDNATVRGGPVKSVRSGEGSWLKVAQIKEGMEIAVAAIGGHAAWERIVSIEPVAEEDVYDVEIEGTHNFIGNGIVAHNTAIFNQASTTMLTNSGNTYLTGITSSLLATNNLGLVIATTSIGVNLLTGTLGVGNGGTGAATFGQGWIYSTGGTTALAASTSPTVNYVVATSTTLASIFPYASTTALTATTGFFTTSTSTTANANTANIGTLNGGTGAFSSTLSVTGASTFTGLGTFANGYVSQASSTVVGLFSSTQASTTMFTNTGATWLTGVTASSLLALDSAGKVVATTSIGTNLLTGTLATINTTAITAGGTFTITAASSTLLSNNNTWTGLQSFANASSTLTTLGTTWFSGISNSLLATDSTGKVVATSSIGANLITGVLGIANGGTNNSAAYNSGSVIFSDGTKLTEDNSNFFWNDSTNRLGVGTTSPQGKLEVVDTSAASTTPLYISNFGSATSSTKVGLAFRTDDVTHNTGTTTASIFSIFQGGAGGVPHTANGDLAFSTLTSGSLTEGMRLTSSNYLGIGTTTPQSLLVVGATFGSTLSVSSAGVVTDGDWNATAIGAQYGGTGIDSSALSGVAVINSGVWSASSTLAVNRGGTGAATLTGLLQGNGTGAVTGITNSSTVGQVLRVTGASAYAWGALDLDDTDAVTGTLPDANLEDAITVSGGTIGSNTISSGSTWTTAGTLTIGDGDDAVNFNTSSWDVTSGAFSGVTTLALSGAITSTATAANTLPYASSTALTVSGHCVTRDTRLRRRRRRADGSYEYDEPEIVDIEEGDEVESLDEKTGELVWSRVNRVLFMGVKQTFRITTEDGRAIRTTAEHPYLVRDARGKWLKHRSPIQNAGWATVANLKEGDEIACAKLACGESVKPVEGAVATDYLSRAVITSFSSSIKRPLYFFEIGNWASNASILSRWNSNVAGCTRNTTRPGVRFSGNLTISRKSVSLESMIRDSLSDRAYTSSSESPTGERVASCPSALSTFTNLFLKFSSHKNFTAVRGGEAGNALSLSAARGEVKSRTDVFLRDGWPVFENLKGGLAVSHGFENLPDHNARSVEGELASADLRVGDNVFVDDDAFVHSANITPERVKKQWSSESASMQWAKIVSIEPVAEEDVYDVEVEGTHNFVAGHYVDARTSTALTSEQEEVIALRQQWTQTEKDRPCERPFAETRYSVNSESISQTENATLTDGGSSSMSQEISQSDRTSYAENIANPMWMSSEVWRSVENLSLQPLEGLEPSGHGIRSPVRYQTSGLSSAYHEESLKKLHVLAQKHGIDARQSARDILQALISKLQVPAESDIAFGGIVAHNTYLGTASATSATTTNLGITGLTNALLSTNANGSVVATTTLSINQYLTGVLPIANGGTNASSFTTTNNAVYYDGTRLVTAGTTQGVTTPYASSTALTVSGTAYFPGSGIWNSSGNVGIGTTNPERKVTIEGTAPVAEIRSGGYLMLRPTDNSWDMRLQTVGTRLDVLSGGSLNTPIASFLNGGNVGIGTTTPASALHVAGQLTMSNSSDYSLVMRHYGANGDTWSMSNIAGAGNAGGLRFYNDDNAAEYMRITNAGNIGIGTTTPFTKLEVNDEIISGNVKTTGGQLRMIEGDYGAFFRNDGTNTYFLLTNADDEYGTWNSLRPLTINDSTGAVSINTTGSGATNIGNASAGLTINSTALDVTSAGAVSGITTLALSGAITSTATAANTLPYASSTALTVSGHCVTADTRLMARRRRQRRRKDGTLENYFDEPEEIAIKDIKAGDLVLSFDERSGRMAWKPVVALYDMGEQPVYKLTTESGKQIRTTGTHPYLTKWGWVRAADLCEGNEIAAPKEEALAAVNLVSKLNFDNIENAVLPKERRSQLPYAKAMCGGGQVSQGFCKNHRVFRGEKLRKLFAHALLDLPVKFVEIAFCFVGQQEFAGHGCYSACTRPALMSSSARSYSRFTSALYSGPKGHFSSSASIVLPSETDSYSLSESFSNIFSSIRQINSQNAIRSNRNHAGFPPVSNPTTARNSFGSFKSPDATLEKCPTRGFAGTSSPLRFADFFLAIGSYATNILHRVSNHDEDIAFERIVSIEYDGVEQVWDIAVSGTHNFVANGIVAHNTYLGTASATSATTTNLGITGLTNALLSTNSAGQVVATTTLSINQYLTGVLPIANGGTNASSFTTTNNAVYYDGTRLVTAGTTQGVTTPYASSTALTVSGHCVTADTRLRRRRRRADGSYEYDEPEIVDIEEGDEIQSLDERTGEMVWSRVNKLMFMGVKQTYRITTEDGREIRTTTEHPYLVKNAKGKWLKHRSPVAKAGWAAVSQLREGDEIAVSSFVMQTENTALASGVSSIVPHTVPERVEPVYANISSPRWMSSEEDPLVENGFVKPDRGIEPLGHELTGPTLHHASGYVQSYHELNMKKSLAWAKIVSIEAIKEEDVYDIEVEGTHNFVANGIVAHNTYLGSASATGAITSTATGANTLPYASSTALSVAGVIYGQSGANTGDVLRVGDDSKLTDIDVANTLGVYGIQDSTIGSLKLGSGGGTISGASGNVGIGTTTPQAKLSVGGGGGAVLDGNEIFQFANAGTVTYGTMRSTANTLYLGTQDSGSGTFLGSYTNTNLALRTASTDRLTITNAGNVGIGTTSPATTLSVAGSGYFTGGLGIGLLNTTAGTIDTGQGANELYDMNQNVQTTDIPTFASLTLSTAGNAGIENGRTDGSASTPFIDFHSGATAVDYDSRIIASGGTGAIGGGTLTINGTLALGTDLAVTEGGTGASTLTGLLQGNGAGAVTGITNSSTVGQILRVTGASTYAWGALDLADTDAVTGVLPIANGGTNASSFTTTNNAVYYDGTRLVTAGASQGVTTPYASSTALTVSGTGFFGLGQFTQTSGTTTIASGQGFTIGASQFVLQQGSGNVGIGTAGPGQALDVNGSIAGSNFYSPATAGTFGQVGGANAMQVYGTTGSGGITSAILFNTGSTERVRINSSGNVGIGTTTPQSELEINTGANRMVNFWNSTNYNTLSLNGSITDAGHTGLVGGASGDDSLYVDAGGSGNINFRTAGTSQKMTILSGGNVGIGTTTPQSLLVVGATFGSTLSVSSAGVVTDGDWQATAIAPAYGGTGIDSSALSGVAVINSGVWSASSTLAVNRGGTGAATLTGLLQGNGTGAVTGITNSSTVGQILRVTGASTYAWGALDLADTDAVTGVLPIANGGTNASSFTTTNNAVYYDGTRLVTAGASQGVTTPYASSTALTVSGTAYFPGSGIWNSSGNVGIGTTNPERKVTIEGTAPVAEIRSGGYLMLRPTDNSWDMRLQTVGTRLDVLSGGSLNTPIASFLNGGNVGIGTTTPIQKLEVHGTEGAADTSGVAVDGIFRVISAGGSRLLDFGTADPASWIQSRDRNNYAVNYSLALNPNGGNVGIGTTTPGANLTIAGVAGENLFQVATSTDQTIFLIDQHGRLAVGTTTPQHNFDIVASSTEATAMGIGNLSLSTSASANFAVANGSGNSDTLQMAVFGTGWTTAGAFVQDGAALNSGLNLSGGLSLVARASGSVMRFYTNGSGSGDERMRITDTGTIGIGTTTPWGTLSIVRQAGPSFVVSNGLGTNVQFMVDNNGNVGTGTTTPFQQLTITTGNIAAFNGAICTDNASAANKCYQTLTAGVAYADSTSIVNSDVAEKYPTLDTTLVPGEIVALDASAGVRVKRASAGDAPLGVVSTAPGVLLGDDVTASIKVAVGLAGRVPVKVNMDGGPIAIGDAITISSSTPGVGMKAVRSMQTIGIAFESASTPGFIEVFIKPEYTFAAQNLSIDSAGNVGIGTTTSGMLPYKLNVQGAVGAEDFINISKREAKADILTVEPSREESILGEIASTTLFTYHYKAESSSSPMRLGLITDSAPRDVLSRDGGGVDIYKLASFVFAGLKAEDRKVDALALRVEKLESEMAKINPSASPNPQGSTFSARFDLADVLAALKTLGIEIAQGIARFAYVVTQELVVGTREKPTGITMYDKVTGEPYCFALANGEATTTSGVCAAIPTTSNVAVSDAATLGAPILAVQGNNPAHISTGSSYMDLGALITGPQTALNLGVHVSVDGSATTTPDQIMINTEVPGTHSISYFATDKEGNIGYAARTVIVEAPAEQVTPEEQEPLVEDGSGEGIVATSTAPVSDAGVATSTNAVSGDTPI